MAGASGLGRWGWGAGRNSKPGESVSTPKISFVFVFEAKRT